MQKLEESQATLTTHMSSMKLQGKSLLTVITHCLQSSGRKKREPKNTSKILKGKLLTNSGVKVNYLAL
jgi:hypothetical protein